MEKLVSTLQAKYPQIKFSFGRTALWSPKTQTVIYKADGSKKDMWAVLHEVGHALLGHTTYDSDTNLLNKEVEAWQKALEITPDFVEEIDQEHIENCLNTYRDWLHRRSTCPSCEMHGIQPSKDLYSCLNCKDVWQVSSARFCRPYRLKSVQN